MIRIFRHHIPITILSLLIIESLVILASVHLSMAIFGQPVSDHTANIGAILLTVVLLLGMTSMGLYQRNNRDKFEATIVRMGASFFISSIIVAAGAYLVPNVSLGLPTFYAAFVTAFLGVLVARFTFCSFADQSKLKRRILVLGAGEKARAISQLRRRSDTRGFMIIGYLPMPGDKNPMNDSKVIKNDVALVDLTKQFNIDEIVVAVDDRRKSLPVHEILQCKMNGVDVIDLLTFFERETGRVCHDMLQPSWMIFSDGFLKGNFRAMVKRSFDIMVSLGMLSIVWPFMLLTALAIKLESRFHGPVFYFQQRSGECGRVFNVMKFRSMHTDAEKDGIARWAKKNDARITKVGSFIRKTRLDELPQIFNVLRGDMSFVGPRPERPEFVEKLQEKIPYYVERHRVKPGITGWAQIRYPYGASEQDSSAKLEYDLYYVKNYSIFLDMLILLQTAEVVLWGKGAR